MDYTKLTTMSIFNTIQSNELKTLMDCLGAWEKTFEKGDIIYRDGDIVQSMGLVLAGSVQIEHIDFWGNKSIIDNVGVGAVFAETYSCLPNEPMMVTVAAIEKTTVVFLNTSRVLHLCTRNCNHHNQLIKNLLAISSRKNLILTRRIFHTSAKTIRGRISNYLSFLVEQQKSTDIIVPFDRQQLADYLSVDRSALSHELSKMQNEGLIEFQKNKFQILAKGIN